MRIGAIAFVLLAACGPRVHVAEPEEDDLDLPETQAVATVKAPTYDQLPIAPETPGARTGTISRTVLDAVLDAGPGPLLQHFEVTAETDDDRFLGWRLVAFDPQHRVFEGVDLLPGDVLIAINGSAIARPDQLESLWEALRTASTITADIRRGDTRFQLVWMITAPATP
jgi:hypothetical protein